MRSRYVDQLSASIARSTITASDAALRHPVVIDMLDDDMWNASLEERTVAIAQLSHR